MATCAGGGAYKLDEKEGHMNSESHDACEAVCDGVSDEVFDILKKRGPLSPAQIGVELGRPVEKVRDALKELESERLVEERPDRMQELETPWGLPRPSFRL